MERAGLLHVCLLSTLLLSACAARELRQLPEISIDVLQEGGGLEQEDLPYSEENFFPWAAAFRDATLFRGTSPLIDETVLFVGNETGMAKNNSLLSLLHDTDYLDINNTALLLLNETDAALNRTGLLIANGTDNLLNQTGLLVNETGIFCIRAPCVLPSNITDIALNATLLNGPATNLTTNNKNSTINLRPVSNSQVEDKFPRLSPWPPSPSPPALPNDFGDGFGGASYEGEGGDFPALAACSCIQVYDPVCVVIDGRQRTYSNSCVANCDGAVVIAEGEC